MDKIVTTQNPTSIISIYHGFVPFSTGMFYCKGFPSVDAINTFFDDHRETFGQFVNSYDPIKFDATVNKDYRSVVKRWLWSNDIAAPTSVSGFIIYGTNGIYYKPHDFFKSMHETGDIRRELVEEFHRTVMIMCGNTAVPCDDILDEASGNVASRITLREVMTFSDHGTTPEEAIDCIIDIDGDLGKYKTTFIFTDTNLPYITELFEQMVGHPHFDPYVTTVFAVSRYNIEECYRVIPENLVKTEYQSLRFHALKDLDCGRLIQKL